MADKENGSNNEPYENPHLKKAYSLFNEAFTELNQFCETDLKKTANEFIERAGNTMLETIDDTTDSVIDYLLEVKKKLKEARRSSSK